MNNLTILATCDGCGACCRVVTQPPFVRHLDGTGELAWDRLVWERADLVAQLQAALIERKRKGEPAYGSPCSWFDSETLQCRHYEYRPRACREFAIGSQDCHDARRRAAVT